MDSKPTDSPEPQTQVIPDLPLSADQAADVKGGKLSEQACKGTHLPEVVIEVW